MKTWILFLIIVCLGKGLSAQTGQSQKPQSTQRTMDSFLDQIIGLKKYLGSDAEFADAKNADAIQKHLKALASAAKVAKHDPKLASENFKFSQQVLEQHLVETERVFRLGNKSYARWMANSTLGICMSCHTQMPAANRKLDALFSLKSFQSEFDKAELLFSARDFATASELFDKIISDYPKTKLTDSQLEIAIHRQAGYYSRILRSPQKGVEILSKYLNNPGLQKYDRRSLNKLIGGFQNWTQLKWPDPSQASAAELIRFAKVQLNIDQPETNSPEEEPQLVSYLFISGLLYEYLNKNPQIPETPTLLYLLAICDRHINNAFFYSLADLYLKECMIQFPASPAAIQCYTEYEENTVQGYTGSSGVHVPPEVKKELKQLKDLISSKGKDKLKEKKP